MSSTVRRHRRERARRRGAVMIKCHTCGREGPRRSMVHRNEQWTCRRIKVCMDRVLLPPPPAKQGYTLAEIEAMRGQIGKGTATFTYAGTTSVPFPFDASADEIAAAGWKHMGYLSDEGIQQ